jgi:hypothetical protein
MFFCPQLLNFRLPGKVNATPRFEDSRIYFVLSPTPGNLPKVAGRVYDMVKYEIDFRGALYT